MINYLINTYKEALGGLSREVWIISILMLINRSGLMVVPFLTLYLTDSLDFSLIQAGIAGMWFGIGSMVSSFAGGWLTDKYGYHNVMKFSLLCGGIAFWALLFAKTFPIFCLMVFLTAFLADLLRPAVMSSVTHYSEEKDRTRAISLLRMAINLGIATGPSIGGFMIQHFGYDWLFILNGASSIITFFTFLYLYKIMKKRVSSESSPANIENVLGKTAYSDYWYLYLLFTTLIMLIAFIQIIFTIPVFFSEVYLLSKQQIGLFFTINGLLIVILEMPIVNYYEKRRLFRKPIIIGGVLMVVAFLSLLIPTGSSTFIWIVPFLLYTFAISIGEIYNLPFINSLSLARSNDNNSGSYMGLFAFNFSLAFTIAPILGSRVVTYFGFDELWILCAVMTGLSVIMFQLAKKQFLPNKNYN